MNVLITGSSKGLGAALALVFARNGFDIVLHGRNIEDLERVKGKVLELGVACRMVVGDLREDETIESLRNVGGSALLINNAAVSLRKPIKETDDEKISELIETNLIAPMKLSKCFSNIININSLSGLEAQAGRSVYCASKWGLKGFSDTLRLEGKRVISVYPTRIKTKGFTEGLEVEDVAQRIYSAFSCGEDEVLWGERGVRFNGKLLRYT